MLVRSVVHFGPQRLRIHLLLFSLHPHPHRSALFPYTTLFRSSDLGGALVFTVFLFVLSWKLTLLAFGRSEEHTSELQSHSDLVCRLLLEKKKGSRGSTTRLWGGEVC